VVKIKYPIELVYYNTKARVSVRFRSTALSRMHQHKRSLSMPQNVVSMISRYNKACSISKNYSLIKVVVVVVASSEYRLLVRCEIKPGLVGRSRNDSLVHMKIWVIINNIVYTLYFGNIKVLVDPTVHYEHGLLIR
jgi:hypothetical protein